MTCDLKVGDDIIWPVRDLPGRIVADNVKDASGELCFVAIVPGLHNYRRSGSPFDGIVKIRMNSCTTFDGAPVQKAPKLMYRNIFKSTNGGSSWRSSVKDMEMARMGSPIEGYLVGEKQSDGSIINIRFVSVTDASA